MFRTNADPAQMAIVTFVGHVDQLDDYVLGGWVYTREEDTFASLQLDVYFASRRILTIRPTLKRNDLEAFFSTTQVGFTADLASIEADILAVCSLATTADYATASIREAIEVQVVGTDISLAKDLFRLGRPFTAGFADGAKVPGIMGSDEGDLGPAIGGDLDTTLPPVGELAWQFDAKFYLDSQPDVRQAGADPAWHYDSFGEKEGRKPNRLFDPAFYRRVYADVREAGISALGHFRDQGRFEGRLPASPFQEKMASNRTILFVGHDSYAAGSQKVLLETVRWFKRHTTLNVRVLLLGFGHLTSDFAAAGKCYTSVNPDKDYDDIIDYLFDGKPPQIVYCNTVVSGRLFQTRFTRFFARSQVIAHCHEMSNVLQEFPAQLNALVHRADRWICASAAIPPYLEAVCHVPADRISTILPFIEPSTISAPALPSYRVATRETFGIPPEAFVVVGCGTLNYRKGPDIFVATARELINRHPLVPIHFVWIGDGEERESLEQAVRDEKLSSAISFSGYRKDSADLIGIADVLFLSSREDPFPLVVLEAAQFGIPSVCFEEGVGIAHFVSEGRGLVCTDRNPLAAAHALEKFWLNRELRVNYGLKAQRSVATDHFTMSAMRKIMAELRTLGLPPAVSVVVPNYNHEKYIDQRLQSITGQSIEDYEIIVLDDCSTDQSLLKISPYLADSRIRLIANERNSGSVFEQWRKGIDLAKADVVWIAESDDFCELDFLERLLPAMADPDVNIAFARTRIVNEAGELQVGAIRPYMERFSPGFGLEDFKSSGPKFVNDGFGALCAIVNASGAVLRKSVTRKALFTTKQFRMCGDWRVYLECCRSGSVYYTAKTTNYFRRHQQSTVHKIEGTDQYFSERLAIAECVVQNFWTTPLLLRKMQAEILNEVSRFSGRFDPSFQGIGNEMAAKTHNRHYKKQEVHVCFYVHGLLFSKGGIERLFALIASALADRGYKISVVCRPAPGKSPVYSLRHGIEVVPIDVWAETGFQQLRSLLVLECVDVLIPMLSEKLFERVVGTTRDLAIPVIASEHNDPWTIEKLWWDAEGRRATFSQCRSIHLLSEHFRTSLPNFLRSRIRVIPNPVTPGFFGCTRRTSQRRRIIAVGRLAAQKHFEILIEAFASIAAAFPEWDLAIFGEGELRPSLEGLLAQYHITGRAFLPGESDRLAEEMETSDIIVMPSLFEGFGMALVEGMAAGLPGVAFADCNGPNEIILDDENGLLVGSRTPEALGDALQRLICDENLRARLGARARGVALRYSLASIVDSWEEMISVDCATR